MRWCTLATGVDGDIISRKGQRGADIFVGPPWMIHQNHPRRQAGAALAQHQAQRIRVPRTMVCLDCVRAAAPRMNAIPFVSGWQAQAASAGRTCRAISAPLSRSTTPMSY